MYSSDLDTIKHTFHQALLLCSSFSMQFYVELLVIRSLPFSKLYLQQSCKWMLWAQYFLKFSNLLYLGCVAFCKKSIICLKKELKSQRCVAWCDARVAFHATQAKHRELAQHQPYSVCSFWFRTSVSFSSIYVCSATCVCVKQCVNSSKLTQCIVEWTTLPAHQQVFFPRFVVDTAHGSSADRDLTSKVQADPVSILLDLWYHWTTFNIWCLTLFYFGCPFPGTSRDIRRPWLTLVLTLALFLTRTNFFLNTDIRIYICGPTLTLIVEHADFVWSFSSATKSLFETICSQLSLSRGPQFQLFCSLSDVPDHRISNRIPELIRTWRPKFPPVTMWRDTLWSDLGSRDLQRDKNDTG